MLGLRKKDITIHLVSLAWSLSLHHFRTWLLGLLLLPIGIRDADATGFITDAVTGKPIEGATVYAAWYYHPWHLPIPVETQQAQIACGGTAVVKTDANGEYDLGIWMNAQIHLHDAHFWVTAPGYYDNHKQQLPRGLDKYRDVLGTVTWNPAGGQASWSRTLTPLGDASIDAKLLAIEASGGDADSCVASRHRAAEKESDS